MKLDGIFEYFRKQLAAKGDIDKRTNVIYVNLDESLAESGVENEFGVSFYDYNADYVHISDRIRVHLEIEAKPNTTGYFIIRSDDTVSFEETTAL